MMHYVRTYMAHATPAQRCLAALLLISPFIVALLIAQNLFVTLESWSGILTPLAVYWLSGIQVLGLCAYAACAFYLWPQRLQDTDRPGVFLLITLIFSLVFGSEAILMGNVTHPMNLVIIGIIPIGCLLLDVRSVAVATVCGLAMIWFSDIAVFADFMPYAPAQAATAFDGVQMRGEAETLRSTIMWVGFGAYAVIFWLLFSQYEYHRRCLQETAQRDALTGLYNRRHFMSELNRDCAATQREPACLILLDADFFKDINDTHGHHAGDVVLQRIAALMQENMRSPVDVAARIGGEEFAILLPRTRLDGATQLCERMRERVASEIFHSERKQFRVTLSAGLVEYRGSNAERWLQQADMNLYKAKERGRNRVVASADAPRTAAVSVGE